MNTGAGLLRTWSHWSRLPHTAVGQEQQVPGLSGALEIPPAASSNASSPSPAAHSQPHIYLPINPSLLFHPPLFKSKNFTCTFENGWLIRGRVAGNPGAGKTGQEGTLAAGSGQL